MTLSVPTRRRLFSMASSIAFASLLAALMLADSQSARAIPAFARKYGMPCSACHEAWPKLNNFGQTFKDNGYQMMNDRDAPIFQPAAFPFTQTGHRKGVARTDLANPATGLTTEGQLTTHGFDLSGLDILTAG